MFSSVKPTQQALQYPFQKRVRHGGKSLGLKLSTTYSVQVRASHLIALSLSFLICKTGTILLHQSRIWLYILYIHNIINIMLYHLLNRHNVHNIFNEHPYVPGTVLTLHISHDTQDRGGTQWVAMKNHILIPSTCFMFQIILLQVNNSGPMYPKWQARFYNINLLWFRAQGNGAPHQTEHQLNNYKESQRYHL